MSERRTIRRGGPYYRVVAPEWIALYLNATVQVAAANVCAQYSGRAIKLFDLLPKARPELVTFQVSTVDVLDACTPDGIATLGFAENFPYGLPWPPCKAIAREAHSNAFAGRFDKWYVDPIPG